MTQPASRDAYSPDLLAYMERSHQQHREEIGALTAAVNRLQNEVTTLKAQAAPASKVHSLPTCEQARRRTEPRWPMGGRATRLGVGVSLALLLLVAPSQSGVSLAYEGLSNTAYGTGALPGDTGSNNSAFGLSALHANPTGSYNTASGSSALYSNTTGSYNTASGDGALAANSSGGYNNAFGTSALANNTSGDYNTAYGSSALYANTTGHDNTSSGRQSLFSNTTGTFNSATGTFSLYYNTTGTNNTVSGAKALGKNTTGANNTAVGYGAGYTDTPANANTTGSNNTFIGYNSGPGTPSEITNATAIGANAVVSQSNSIVLGGIGANTQRIGVGTTTPHSAFQIAKGFLQIRPITGLPAPEQCVTADDAGRLVVRTDGNINLYVCNGSSWIGK